MASSRHLRAAAFAALLSSALCGQSSIPLPAGYAAREVVRETGHAIGFRGFAPGRGPGELFYAVDHAVWHRDAHGMVTLVHAYPNPARCDLIVRPPGSPALLYADDRSGRLVVHDVASGTESTRALVANTFDVTAIGGALLAAANPLWPAPGARPGVWRLDPSGGSAHREVVALPVGASGPLAVDPSNGDLVVATLPAIQPTPAGAVTLLRFPSARLGAAIAGGARLTVADASVIASGLDGAFDLAFDDRGCIFVSNPGDGRVERVRADGRVDATPFVGANPSSALGLAFVDGDRATFDPWQPDRGGALLIAINDWSTLGAVVEVRSARPQLTSASGPIVGPGVLRLDLDGLPARQPFQILLNPLPLVAPEPVLFELGGVPVWCAIDLRVPPLSVVVVADAAGAASVGLPYAGGVAWTLAFQAAGLDPSVSPPLLVTSTPRTVTLLP